MNQQHKLLKPTRTFTTIVRAPKSSHISPAAKSLHWFKIKQRIDYQILSPTHKVLTTAELSYLYNLISV